MNKTGYRRDYVKYPVTREELVVEVMNAVDALARAKKVLDKWDKEHKEEVI